MNIQHTAVTHNFLSQFKFFARHRFRNMGDRENDFQRMSSVGNEKYPQPLSDRFILESLHALESNITMHDRLRVLFVDGAYLKAADQLNWELKRTPVIFEHHQPVSWVSGSRQEGSSVFDHLDIRIEASSLPVMALPYGIKTLAEVPFGFVVCFFDASHLTNPTLPFWDISFRIDRDIVKALHQISEFENVAEDETLSCGQSLESPVESNTQEQQEMKKKEEVYNFIALNSPVPTRILLAQKICAESHLHRILQSLLEEKKIIKFKHGVYRVTNY